MTEYESYVANLRKQFLNAMENVSETQAKLIEAVRAVPTTSENLPSPAEYVERSFDFFTQVLAAQKDATLRLIKASGVTPAKTAAKQTA
jgi:septation ring formation regulator EzrA